MDKTIEKLLLYIIDEIDFIEKQNKLTQEKITALEKKLHLLNKKIIVKKIKK